MPSAKVNKSATKGIWSSLLDSVSSGKRLDEKTLVMLGGNVESQNDFLEAISKDAAATAEAPLPSIRYRRNQRDLNQRKKVPIANQFALGYTYQDVIGADQDDILCRLHVYMMADTRPVFAPLLSPLFTPQTIPNMLVVILLDWENPWNWLRQLLERIKMLHSILDAKDAECKTAMDETMEDWRQRRRGPANEDTAIKPSDFNNSYPLGPGEWDEPLGVPVCVVCHNAEKIDILEREHGWKDREFDTVMQYLRTVLLKHGGSLIYTSPSDAGSLQTLVRSSMGIQTLQRKATLKRNVTDRDKVLIPPNWDTWGNIRAQNDKFDPAHVSKSWTVDIQLPATTPAKSTNEVEITPPDGNTKTDSDPSETLKTYALTIRPPYTRHTTTPLQPPVLKCPDYQTFLASQAERLASFKARDEAAAARAPPRPKRDKRLADHAEVGYLKDHLGPIQFNVGGVQVDAEAAVEALKRRTAVRVAEEEGRSGGGGGGGNGKVEDKKKEEEKMRAYLMGLKAESKPGSPAR